MGKKSVLARDGVDLSKVYTIEDAIELIQARAFTKFDQALDIAINLGIDPKRSEQTVKGGVVLPAGVGKAVRVLVVCRGDQACAEARDAGADIIGAEDAINEIRAGKINFDVCIATPNMMGLLGGVGRILGPKKLMPDPKLGTVTSDLTNAIKNAKSGQVKFSTGKGGTIVHAGIGRLSFSSQALSGNVRAFIDAVLRAKPQGAKGTYLNSIYLGSTMGFALRVSY